MKHQVAIEIEEVAFVFAHAANLTCRSAVARGPSSSFIHAAVAIPRVSADPLHLGPVDGRDRQRPPGPPVRLPVEGELADGPQTRTALWEGIPAAEKCPQAHGDRLDRRDRASVRWRPGRARPGRYRHWSNHSCPESWPMEASET